jgi:hypothetical protein
MARLISCKKNDEEFFDLVSRPEIVKSTIYGTKNFGTLRSE